MKDVIELAEVIFGLIVSFVTCKRGGVKKAAVLIMSFLLAFNILTVGSAEGAGVKDAITSYIQENYNTLITIIQKLRGDDSKKPSEDETPQIATPVPTSFQDISIEESYNIFFIDEELLFDCMSESYERDILRVVRNRYRSFTGKTVGADSIGRSEDEDILKAVQLEAVLKNAEEMSSESIISMYKDLIEKRSSVYNSAQCSATALPLGQAYLDFACYLSKQIQDGYYAYADECYSNFKNAIIYFENVLTFIGGKYDKWDIMQRLGNAYEGISNLPQVKYDIKIHALQIACCCFELSLENCGMNLDLYFRAGQVNHSIADIIKDAKYKYLLRAEFYFEECAEKRQYKTNYRVTDVYKHLTNIEKNLGAWVEKNGAVDSRLKTVSEYTARAKQYADMMAETADFE